MATPTHRVGALIAHQVFSDGTWAYCSGTPISPTVFLTAAHCGDPGQTSARVSFSSQYHEGDRVYVGRYVPGPRHGGGQSAPHDLAVVVSATPIRTITPARLPALGLLDRLRAAGTLQSATFTSVGYGALAPTTGRRGLTFRYTDIRNRSHGSFNALTDAWLRLSQNPHQPQAGRQAPDHLRRASHAAQPVLHGAWCPTGACTTRASTSR